MLWSISSRGSPCPLPIPGSYTDQLNYPDNAPVPSPKIVSNFRRRYQQDTWLPNTTRMSVFASGIDAGSTRLMYGQPGPGADHARVRANDLGLYSVMVMALCPENTGPAGLGFGMPSIRWTVPFDSGVRAYLQRHMPSGVDAPWNAQDCETTRSFALLPPAPLGTS